MKHVTECHSEEWIDYATKGIRSMFTEMDQKLGMYEDEISSLRAAKWELIEILKECQPHIIEHQISPHGLQYRIEQVFSKHSSGKSGELAEKAIDERKG